MTTNREKSKNRTMKEKIKVIADTTNAYTLEKCVVKIVQDEIASFNSFSCFYARKTELKLAQNANTKLSFFPVMIFESIHEKKLISFKNLYTFRAYVMNDVITHNSRKMRRGEGPVDEPTLSDR